ncbi:MAG: Uma2 family endonuclease, partial [Thiotrichales bacterium]
LIFEVLSPSTADKDRHTKFALYEREGVAWYCIVDPESAVAKVYRLHDGRYIKHLDATDEVVDFDLGKCTARFDFGRIWPE